MAVADHFDTVQKIYIAFYQRPADPAGLRYWAERIEVTGGNTGAVIDAFAASEEATALYGEITNENIGEAVTAIYQALFGRTPDAAGLAYYEAAFEAGELSAGTIALSILDGASGEDTIAINNKLAVANEFTQQVAGQEFDDANFGQGGNFVVTYDAEDVEAAREILAGVTANPTTVLTPQGVAEALQEQIANEGEVVGGGGSTFTLTTGADAIVGTSANDTINAFTVNATGTPASTFGAFDSINGGAGTDTLNIFVANPNGSNNDFNTEFPANASVSNVEIVNINYTGPSVNGSLLNVANYQGVEQFWQAGAAGSVTNVDESVTVGFRNVTGTTLDGDTVTTATGATTANIALANAVGSLNTSGATTVNVSGTKAEGTFNLGVNTTGSANTVVVNSAVATTLTTALAAVTTINASGSTGAITYVTDAGDVSVTTGSGADSITVNGLAANATINLGAGDDTLTGTAAAVASGTYDGGEGRDTVASTLVNAGNGSKFLNFEVLGLNNSTLDLSLLSGSDIEALELLSAGGNYTNVQLGQSLSVTSNVGAGVTTLNFAGATGAADSYAISFDAASTATTAATATAVNAGTVSLNGAENITIDSSAASGFTSNQITVASSTAETVTVTGDQALNLAFASNFGLDAAGNEVTSINASAATGAVTINLANVTADAAGLTVVGGSANDTLITSAFAATLTGGEGADTFNVAATTYGAGVYTTITDFSAGDIIDFSPVENSGTSVALGAAVNVSTATTLEAALTLAATNTEDALVWFQYGNNTYLLNDVDDGADDIATGDQLVVLTGLVDLSDAQYNEAGGSLTFA